ncbi:DUF2249 domain-containing protein [Mycobacterium antarcticum]|uniref:DUF2249 domain-containing protein n=1 Tax=Mycolicibacterium sp. TUM20984 TaxID=3023368 RepID=UPI0023918E05|nr:DUF2249 domain-containing protein [Mycolicibacterium sp. TUM20984]GLP80990.1 hypothetical protein TUM20984_24100 [Mycolicibacterium sp. TUM20984]
MNQSHVDGIQRQDLDVREIAKPLRHPLIFDRFDALAVGESFVLVNSHDPKHLRQEFERDHPGEYDWDYLHKAESERQLWRIQITRRTAIDLPRVVCDTKALTAATAAPADRTVWTIETAQRQLDANVIRLQPEERIEWHTDPNIDVLWHVLAGDGQLITINGAVPLTEGTLVWLPHLAQRAVAAGKDGLSYLTVHTRRPGLTITPAGL